MTEVQKEASQEIASRLNKSAYQFHRKGNEIQYHFNVMVENSMNAAKKEFTKISLPTNKQRDVMKKATDHLDEGIKAIAKRHIKVADHSDYGWTTVQSYDNDAPASDSDDKKRLEKAKKEAEKLVNKRHRRVGQIGGQEEPGVTQIQYKLAEAMPPQARHLMCSQQLHKQYLWRTGQE